MIIRYLNKHSFVISNVVIVAVCLSISAWFGWSYSALQREITLLRLETQQNRQEIDAMKRTQEWMQAEIFYLRGRK